MVRVVRALAVAGVLGAVAVVWAGTVFDGAGRFEFGTWASLWGGVAALTGLGLGAGGRLGRAVLASAMGVVALATWTWIALWRVPIMTLEGAWLYPLAAVATAVAVLAARSSVDRAPGDG